MPAISPGDLILWRTHPYSSTGLWYFDSPPVVFRAQVDGDVTFPAADIPFHSVTIGSHSTLKRGMTVVFESAVGADDLGRSRIRRIDGSTSQVRIGRCSQGTEDGTCNVVNGSYISVYDDRRIWAKIPYIDTNTLVSYKDFDFDFATYGFNQGAVINFGLGPCWLVYLDATTSVGTLSINTGTLSYGIDGNIASYANDIADGTYTVGGSTTAAWTATFPPGRRYISVATTDTNSIVTYRDLLVVVLKDGTAYTPIRHFELTSPLNPKMTNGSSLSVKVYDSIPRSTYPDGFFGVFFESENYGSTTKTLNDQNDSSRIKFAGWHQPNADNIRGDQHGTQKETTLTFLDTSARLNTLPGFTQEMARKLTSDSWTQAKGANWDKYEAVLTRWHSTAMEVTDFHGANQGDLYAFSILGSGEMTLYRQAEELADRGLGYHLTCTMQGRLLLEPDPLILPTNLRTSIVIIELQDDDITDIRYTQKRPPTTYWNKGGAVLTSPSDFDNGYTPTVKFALAPGNAPGMGGATAENNQQLCVSLGEILIRTENRYARENAQFGYVEVDLANIGDFGYDPAYLQWVKLNLSADNAAQRGITFNGQRCLLIDTKVTYRASKEGVIKDKVTLLLEVETVGSGVVEEIQPVDPNPPAPQPTITTPTNTGVIDCSGIQVAIGMSGNQVLRADSSKIGLVINVRTSPSVVFLSVTGLPAGAIHQVLPDPFGSFWINRTGTAPAYCLANGGVYYITDIFDCSQSWTLYQALTNLSGGVTNVMRVDHAVQGAVVVLWWRFDSGGRFITRITSSGVAWQIDIASRQFDVETSAIDIDQTGLDIVWTANIGGFSDPNVHVYKITNGTPVIKKSFNWAFQDRMVPAFIQLTGSTVLLAMQANNNRPNLVYSSDEFVTTVDISQPDHICPAQYISSMIPVDNPNIMAMAVVPYAYGCTVPTCSNKEGVWVSNGSRGATWRQISGTTAANSGSTSGYKADDHTQIYAAGTSDAVYINGLTGVAQSTLGNWGTVDTAINTEIPL